MISLAELPAPLVIALMSACWLVVGVVSGWVGYRTPLSRLDHDTWLTTPRGFERGGRFYDRTLRIRRWKDVLPEAGDAFGGGFSKAQLHGTGDADLARFVAETRRAEYVHWANAAAGPLFAVFEPAWIAVAMTGFGLAVHLPFVAIQRYNRARLQRTLARRRVRRSRPPLSSPHADRRGLPT